MKGIGADHVDERDRIYISIGGNGEHLTHPVTNPIGVTFKRGLGGAHEGLDIASSDGTVTSVRFRIAARPETLDGVRHFGFATHSWEAESLPITRA